MASLLLAVLWALSVFGGWGVEAFCPAAESPGACADRIASAARFSGAVALFAAASTGVAWFTKRQGLLGVAVFAWVAAVGVLFVGGVIAQ
ncbi:hypothetical protein GCM10023194_79110 [Planotetraspora phitsanulokensis]|uniref:Uncharacterized protein n=1 Tax=Planotetraspora phitsanulokensis TaxID=575192 RepID=A0A8J3UG73_9ACTN|nr:hypothetical protein [Planotetraspora phitsanulokensis]GII43122.1 hypothetical protein Pph01_81250 [Planotetraspora phitsanulokensis]